MSSWECPRDYCVYHYPGPPLPRSPTPMKRLSAVLALGTFWLSPLYGAGVELAQAQQAAPARAGASAPAPVSAEECAILRRRFQESSACFAPFMNTNGSVKPEAFKVCGPAVPYPARECSSTPAY
jgi:hypothetical protein